MDNRINVTSSQGTTRTNEFRHANPVVSIITVVYNGKELLEKTIHSIVNQSFKSIEYIVIDGKSTDGTLDVIKKNEAHINYWVSEPDKGIYDAMNKAMHHAKGTYIWFLNAGDLIESSETLTKIFSSSPDADIIYGETNMINSHGEILGTRSTLTTRKLPIQMNWKDMKKGMVVSHQSILVKKSIAPEYDLKYRCSSDIDWVIKSLKRSHKIMNANMILSRYLIGGFSAKNLKKSLMERFLIYMNHYGLFDTLKVHIGIAINAFNHALSGRKNF
jgi:glycosyltransferase involved in cell wall biosynthesis